MTAKQDAIVHVLRHGRPLCGFTEDLPRDWPEGHCWVAITDVDKATHDLCVSRAKELLARPKEKP